MAVDHFLDLTTGGITGESGDDDVQFKNKAIEVDSWSVAASNPPDLTSAKTGAGTGRVSCGGFHFTAKQTKATSHLFDRVVQGTHIPTATLTCRKAGGGQKAFHVITMEEVYVGDHQLSGSQGSENNTDSFTLYYGSIKHEYFVQSTNGTTASAGAKKWDLRSNKAT
jgi:type VI secretion system secreted protein Hcp